MIRTIAEPARELTVRKETDVLVIGGGPSGIMAALAAAEDGLNVMLVESRSFVGGNMTIGLPILGFLGQKGNQIIKGLPQKLIDRLKAVQASSEHRPCPLHMSLTLVEPEAVKTVALQMLVESKVDVLFYAFCAGVVMEKDELKGVIIESKAGREVILAKTIIDCSGDADVAYRAGVPCEYGNENGGVQPPTLMFCLGGVDTEKLRTSIANEPRTYLTDFIPAEYFGQNNQFVLVGMRNLIKQAQEDGLTLTTERTILITGLRKGEVWVNMTRVSGVNGTDPGSLTHGEIEGRHQIQDIQKYLIEYVPGFENAYFLKTAPFLGIRETRRIQGQYTMTREDIMACQHFDDAIAVASYPLDIHHPQGGGCTLEWCGDCYDIPYRSLIPQKVKNLIVAGRCISTTHEAMSAIRVMAPCMAMGEAAGRAAKMAVRQGVQPADIDVKKLQKELLEKGAYLRIEKEQLA
ncbi:FAD-dependent oxidoreductase [Pseudobacter ginsenosidimutans]|uniref:FAD dependent oxidoreductase n=1 Tax=Pseudobacter ginsenosidimutans TaxID=661488 RepID=A0A4Q7MSB8_9BACT|nr:FAD-dependent oxidoreductase [Pseudobacter ginsenosidimutans]QEC41521.1 FAD-dependent oxidoreductase [Pseudobacter ginsenosidimutans]RZS71696.1 FAD dependent oxidoreductase [Pseudobacter ginsenosidimutans]